MILDEVCDIVVSHYNSRFAVTGQQCFSANAAKSFPSFDEMKLHSELSVIYSRTGLRHCCGAVSLLQLLIGSNLTETFSETVYLLKTITIVTIASCEAERCFSTLKSVKTLLRNTLSKNRLNALAMFSIEKNLVIESIDFNQNMIDMFANLKNRRAKFLFK